MTIPWAIGTSAICRQIAGITEIRRGTPGFLAGFQEHEIARDEFVAFSRQSLQVQVRRGTGKRGRRGRSGVLGNQPRLAAERAVPGDRIRHRRRVMRVCGTFGYPGAGCALARLQGVAQPVPTTGFGADYRIWYGLPVLARGVRGRRDQSARALARVAPRRHGCARRVSRRWRGCGSAPRAASCRERRRSACPAGRRVCRGRSSRGP